MYLGRNDNVLLPSPWSLFQNKNNVFYRLCNLFSNSEAHKRKEQKLPCIIQEIKEGGFNITV